MLKGEHRGYRYPGSAPFRDLYADRRIFKGRETEKQSLLHLVLAESLVTVFAKSGAGKTSLLEAGIFQPMRERGYMPIVVRFNDPGFTPVESVFLAIRETVRKFELVCTSSDGTRIAFLNSQTLGELKGPGQKRDWLNTTGRATLWDFLQDMEFWSSGKKEPGSEVPYWPKENRLLTPLLILDQFEEFFIQYTVGKNLEAETWLHGKVREGLSGIASWLSDFPGVRYLKRRLQKMREGDITHMDNVLSPSKKEFIRQLAELVRGTAIPTIGKVPALAQTGAGVAEIAEGGEIGANGDSSGDPDREETEWDGAGYRDKACPKVKTLLSMREDYLGNLEEVAGMIPEIFHKRFRLMAMGPSAASDAIIEPAELESGDFDTPPFRYSDDCLKMILGFLGKVRRRGKLIQSDEIEPFQLQVICEHIEKRILAEGKPAGFVVESAYLGGIPGLKKIQEAFYDSKVKSLPGMFNKRRARKVCENALIGSNEQRRSRDDTDLHIDCRATPALLELLVNSRLLRAEERAGSIYYELSHDSMVEPILASKNKRRIKRWVTSLVLSASIILPLMVQKGREIVKGREVEIRSMVSDSVRDSIALVYMGKETLLSELRIQAASHIEKKEFVEANAVYEKALDKYPDDMETLLLILNLQVDKLHDFNAGYEYAAKIHRLNPLDLSNLANFVEANLIVGRLDSAIVLADELSIRLTSPGVELPEDRHKYMVLLRSTKASALALQGKRKESDREIHIVMELMKNFDDSTRVYWDFTGVRYYIAKQHKLHDNAKRRLTLMLDLISGNPPGRKHIRKQLALILAAKDP